MSIAHKGHTDSVQVYSVTVMTHVKALQAGHSSQGTSEPITPVYTVPFIAGRGPMCYLGLIGRHRAKNAWSGKFIGVASTYKRCYNDNLTIFVTEDTRCYQVLVTRPDVVSIQARLWADKW